MAEDEQEPRCCAGFRSRRIEEHAANAIDHIATELEDIGEQLEDVVEGIGEQLEDVAAMSGRKMSGIADGVAGGINASVEVQRSFDPRLATPSR